jgi:hypothetical protein
MATACSDQSTRARLTEPLFAKAPASPTVTSASPAYAYQGTVSLNVTINGFGFDNGSRASWYSNGAPYSKITVNSTSYVSASRLVANISVASDAAISAYDIVVTASTTKQGIGSDCFVVTLAVPIPVVGNGINMAAQVVGDLAGSSKQSGNVWDPQAGLVPLPNANKVWGIDESGSTISGKDNNGAAAIWTSSTGAAGPWTETLLPMPQGLTVGAARGLASDVNGKAVFLAGAHPNNAGLNGAMIWMKDATGWHVRVDTLPTGVPGGWAQAANAKGQTVGMDGSAGAFALYWDSVGTAAILSSNAATAYSISGDGTVVVGSAHGKAAMWIRTLINGMYGPWSGDIYLDTASCGSAAFAVNAAGTVAVGASCNQPVAWNISGTGATEMQLGTLGPPNSGTAFAINNLLAPNAAGGGGANGSGFSTGVLWKSF